MRALHAAGPPLLFGLRMWVAVCFALTVAFWLELDSPSWAGTSAAIVCQPVLGASLRKGWFRMIGTVIGAVAAVVLTACFPQSRVGFLLALALWGGICAFFATILRNFASYAAALAGYTAAIVAGDQLGAVGGANGQAFMLAVNRATEICLGIVCAGIVLAGTDFGRARRQLAATLSGLATEITGRLIASFHLSRSEQQATQMVRRDLISRVAALDSIIDQAKGESPDLRFNPRPLQEAMEGLFTALSGWRIIANHLAVLPDRQGAQESAAILRVLPAELKSVQPEIDAAGWAAEPSRITRVCLAAIRALVALPANTPSQRLLADRTAGALFSMTHALGGLVLLRDPRQAVSRHRIALLRVPDLLPPLLNGVRAFLTIGVAAIVWIVTAWPGGALAITFAAVTVILLSPRADQAYAAARGFLLGTVIATAFAAIVAFAVLPTQPSYAGFCVALGLVLVPAGALTAQPWQQAVFAATAMNFVPVLGPANQMSYDVQQFYNSAMGIIVGVGIAMLALRLIPPLSPAIQSRRLLALVLRDLRRLAGGAIPTTPEQWEEHVYGRVAALPDQSDPVQRSWLAAALSVGAEITRLHHAAGRFDLNAELNPALAALARGDSAATIASLARLDDALAAIPADQPGATARLRARGDIAAVSEALAQHSAYFES